MEAKALLRILYVAEKLKCNTRHSWTSDGRKESVAEHSWRLALMAMLLRDEFSELDMDRVIRMCLIHDLGEAFTGDVPAFEKNKADERKEEAAYRKWIDSFPEPCRQEFLDLLGEMKERKTPEAKLYKALDRLEAVIQHDEADLATWEPLEYELQFAYGKEEIRDFPYLVHLRKEIDRNTARKIALAEEDQVDRAGETEGAGSRK